jgi:hypothetical protein
MSIRDAVRCPAIEVWKSPLDQAIRSGAAFSRYRSISPANAVPGATGGAAGRAMSTTFLQQLSRTPYWIGSGDCDSVSLAFLGFFVSTFVQFYANDYQILGCYFEKDGSVDMSTSIQVKFSGSGSASVASGLTKIVADRILPSQFGLPKFTRGDKYWVRLRLGVASAGQVTPVADISKAVAAGASALDIDTAVYTGTREDNFGTIATGASGFTAQTLAYHPILLGSFVGGADPKTIGYTGDSLAWGQNDTPTARYLQGGIQRALYDADGVSNPIGGLKIAVPGITASLWAAAQVAGIVDLMQYTKYFHEEFGANEYLTAPGTVVATAIAKSQVIYDFWTGQGGTVAQLSKNKLTPRSTSVQTMSAISAVGTTVTVTTSGGNPINGNTVTIAGCTPAAYNGTFVATNTGAGTFTYTAGSAPGTATVVGTWSDQWATTANQVPFNAAWAAAGNARAYNAAIDTLLSGAKIGAVVSVNSIRGGTTEGTDLFYQWISNGTPNSIINESTHPLAAGCVLEANDYRAYIATLT